MLMPATARPPFVWAKPHTHGVFARVPLHGLFDVADLAAAARGVGGDSPELLLVAPPSAQPPPPSAIASALLSEPLLVSADLLDAGVVPGCWLLTRVSADAQSASVAAALAAVAHERQERMATEAALAAEKTAHAIAETALIAAMAARATAEADAAREREVSLAAEAARATAEADAAREREARLAAKFQSDKAAFLALMLSISSAGSEWGVL